MELLLNLKLFRQELGLTQKQIAESIGINQQQWSRYENGTNELPLRYFIELCKVHNVSADKFLSLPMENTQIEYFSRIKQVRQANGDSQQKLANLFDTTQHQISKYETGLQELPIRRLKQFCQHYQVSADYILGLTDNPHSTK